MLSLLILDKILKESRRLKKISSSNWDIMKKPKNEGHIESNTKEKGMY